MGIGIENNQLLNYKLECLLKDFWGLAKEEELGTKQKELLDTIVSTIRESSNIRVVFRHFTEPAPLVLRHGEKTKITYEIEFIYLDSSRLSFTVVS